MKLHFSYNIEKDIENFINGTRAVNSKKPTKFQTSFSEKYGDNFETEKVGLMVNCDAFCSLFFNFSPVKSTKPFSLFSGVSGRNEYR